MFTDDTQDDESANNEYIDEYLEPEDANSLEETVLDMKNLLDPLYDGASITVCGTLCAIMQFQSSCRCSFSTIAHLEQLLQLLCPSDNKLP